MKPHQAVAAYAAVLAVLAFLAWLLHWSWEQAFSGLGVFLFLAALNFGRSKLVGALAPKHPLAAKVGPELALVALALWAIEAKICGPKSNLWIEICTAAIFLSAVWQAVAHFRNRHDAALQAAEEQADAEARS